MEDAEDFRPPAKTVSTTELIVETDPTGRFTRSSEVLGKGSSKVVYKGFDRIEGIEVAWNQASLTSGNMDVAHRLLHTEVSVLKRLKHRNIMNFIASWVDTEQGTLNFITEYFHTGCLKRHRLAHKFISTQLLKRWAWQILQGLVYLHGHYTPIIHRDLKCDNIFIHGVTGEVKIGDLGLARLMEENMGMCHTCIGTPEFMAPELYKEQYNEKVDVYSFGMCLLEMITMAYPYSECKSACQIYRHVSQGIYPQSLSKVVDKETRAFIELCISHDHEDRPAARKLVKHKFFDCIRLANLTKQPRGRPMSPELSLEDDSQQSTQGACYLDVDVNCPSDGAEDVDSLDGLQRLMEGESGTENDSEGMVEPLDATRKDVSDWEDLSEEASVVQSGTKFCVQHRDSPQLPFNDVVNFELSVGTRTGSKRLMFSFDVERDTVEDVGLELEEEFNLTAEEREQFTDVLRQELERVLRRKPEDTRPLGFNGTFGSIVVSMSLEDWTEEKCSVGTVAHARESTLRKKDKSTISFKIKVEKSRSMNSLETALDDAMKQNSDNNLPTRAPCDRSGKVWENLLHHIQRGAASLRHNSLNRSLKSKMVKLCGDDHVVSNEEAVVCSTSTVNNGSIDATDTAMMSPGTPLVGQKGRKAKELKHTRSASAVLSHVRSVTGAVRHLQAAAVMLYRNSLDLKRISFEIRRKSSSKSERKKRSKNAMPEGMESNVPEDKGCQYTVEEEASVGCINPSIARRGASFWKPLRRFVLWPRRRWRRCDTI